MASNNNNTGNSIGSGNKKDLKAIVETEMLTQKQQHQKGVEQVNAHTYMHSHTYIYIHTFIFIHTFTHTYIHFHVHMCRLSVTKLMTVMFVSV